MQIGHVGGAVSSPSITKPELQPRMQPRLEPSGERSEDLIHQFLQVGDVPQPAQPNFGLGVPLSPARKYSPEFVKLLQQIAGDPKLPHELKKKLFKTAYSLVSGPAMVSHHIILGLPGNPKSYSVFRRGRHSHCRRHYEGSQR